VADAHDSHPINLTRLIELTPDGRYLRAFTGGEYLSTSLRSRSIAFSPDGKLLAGSAAFTDAGLAFTEGGRVVRRFATLVVAALTADQRGNVYVAGGSSREQGVYVFNGHGDLLRTIGAVNAGNYIYDGVAVDERGNLFVGNNRDHVIEVYDASRRRLGIIKGGGLHHPRRLALSPNGNLYVIDEDRSLIKVFNPSRRAFLFSFPSPQSAQLSDLTFGPNGHLFVTAFWT
jgi:sugar lactone lactonase YvrE